MNEDRMDLSPLDPTREPERFDRIVAAIGSAAAFELARRRARTGPMGEITRWRRPMLAAAAALVIASAAVLSRVGPSTTTDPDGFVIAIGIPEALAPWVRSDQTPTLVDLLSEQMEEEAP